MSDASRQGSIAAPFKYMLPKGFEPGSSLDISVYLHDDVDRVAFNLVCHATTTMKPVQIANGQDVAFHFNPRLNEDVIVRNTYQSGQWGNEERAGGIPLYAGCEYSLKFVCERHGYRIFINDIEYTFYRHRMPPKNITHLVVQGLVTLNNVTYKTTPASQYGEDVYTQELQLAGQESPFECMLHKGFGPGSSLDISVYLHDDVDRVSFDLVCHGQDVAFHFNPRLNEDVIVRNTYQSGQWGNEERAGGIPLYAGCEYSLKFVCERHGYRIFINDIEYTFYRHRMPPKNITHLVVQGLVTLNNVTYKTTPASRHEEHVSTQELQVAGQESPFKRVLDDSFEARGSLYISVRFPTDLYSKIHDTVVDLVRIVRGFFSRLVEDLDAYIQRNNVI